MESSKNPWNLIYALNGDAKKSVETIRQFQELENEIIQLTGFSLGQLKVLFAEGYTLQPPKKPVSILELLRENY